LFVIRLAVSCINWLINLKLDSVNFCFLYALQLLEPVVLVLFRAGWLVIDLLRKVLHAYLIGDDPKGGVDNLVACASYSITVRLWKSLELL
jgi:hypothetical protein